MDSYPQLGSVDARQGWPFTPTGGKWCLLPFLTQDCQWQSFLGTWLFCWKVLTDFVFPTVVRISMQNFQAQVSLLGNVNFKEIILRRQTLELRCNKDGKGFYIYIFTGFVNLSNKPFSVLYIFFATIVCNILQQILLQVILTWCFLKFENTVPCCGLT